MVTINDWYIAACGLVVAMIHIYLLSFDSICSIGYCGTSYGAEISFDVWRRLGWSSSVFPATKIFAISRNSLLGLPFPLTSPTALRLLTSNPAGLSLPNQGIGICYSIRLTKVWKNKIMKQQFILFILLIYQLTQDKISNFLNFSLYQRHFSKSHYERCKTFSIENLTIITDCFDSQQNIKKQTCPWPSKKS